MARIVEAPKGRFERILVGAEMVEGMVEAVAVVHEIVGLVIHRVVRHGHILLTITEVIHIGIPRNFMSN